MLGNRNENDSLLMLATRERKNSKSRLNGGRTRPHALIVGCLARKGHRARNAEKTKATTKIKAKQVTIRMNKMSQKESGGGLCVGVCDCVRVWVG